MQVHLPFTNTPTNPFLYSDIENCIQVQRSFFIMTYFGSVMNFNSWSAACKVGEKDKGLYNQIHSILNFYLPVSVIQQNLSPGDSYWVLGIQMQPLHPCSEHRKGSLPSGIKTNTQSVLSCLSYASLLISLFPHFERWRYVSLFQFQITITQQPTHK